MVTACGERKESRMIFQFSDLSNGWDMVLYIKIKDTGGTAGFEGGKSRSEDLKIS